MRRKIKELMNKEEGFTLVELLAVIVILGIIVAIAVPMIGNVTGRAQTGAETAQKELVIDAAQLYMVENPNAVTYTTDKGDINVKTDLIENGYLENDENLTGVVTVTRKLIGSSTADYTYTYEYTK